MKRSMMACAALSIPMVTAMATLAGCSSTGGNDTFAARDTTVEYYRVFDIKTTAPAETVAKAASNGINRNLKEAQVATQAGAQVTDLPGHFKIADPTSAPPGTAVEKGPSCDGASWTAKAAPKVRGSDNMNLVACLFPYKSGYHLDMYAVFTKPEGGWLSWPRHVGGMVWGTPEKFTEATMMDLVRAIREGTGANVSLVEAKPNLAGTPWLEPGKAGTAQASAAAPVSTAPAAPATAPAPTVPTAAANGPASGAGATAAAGSAPGEAR